MISARRSHLILALLCLTGALARVVTTYFMPNIAHPDETFQYLEQAYRLSAGQGLVPWEYVVGARSWILAGAIAPFMKAGLLLSSQPAVHLWAVTLFMIAASTVAIIAAFVLGARAGGTSQAFFAGLLAACWSELVYLSPHVLADTAAGVPLIGAWAVSYKEAPTGRRMMWAGVLFGLAFVLRTQLAPAIAIAMLTLCGRHFRSRHVPMGIGFLGPLFVMGVVDWITWGAPFRSTWVYLTVNAGGVADAFGSSPPLTYVRDEVRIWGFATPLILVTAWIGAKKLPLIAVEVVVIVVTFSLIGHKEYRFIYPALPLLFVLCGVGTGDLVEKLMAGRPRAGHARQRGGTMLAASTIWLAASAVTGAQAPMREKWFDRRDWLDGLRIVNDDPAACGIGITPHEAWSATGYVRLRRGIQLYDATPPTPAAYNYLFTSNSKAQAVRDISSFHQVMCNDEPDGLCAYKRSGGCDPAQGRRLEADPDAPLTSFLRRHGLLPH